MPRALIFLSLYRKLRCDNHNRLELGSATEFPDRPVPQVRRRRETRKRVVYARKRKALRHYVNQP